MRKTIKTLCMAVMAMGLISLVACKDDPVEPDNTPTTTAGNGTYALHFNDASSAALKDGATVEYTVQDWERELHMAYINFYVENQTNEALVTDQLVELVDGPDNMTYSLCAGGECPEPPAMPPTYTVAAKSVHDQPITIEPHLEDGMSGTATFKLTVGKAGNVANTGVVAYVKINL